MPNPETLLTRKILAALRESGGAWFKLHGGPYQAGLPDIIGIKDGVFFAFEVKVPGRRGRVTAHQQAALDQVNANGGRASVITGVAEALMLLGEG